MKKGNEEVREGAIYCDPIHTQLKLDKGWRKRRKEGKKTRKKERQGGGEASEVWCW